MQPFQDFSSWQPEQERQFVVFEQRTMEASKRAWAIGIFAGVALGVAVIAIAVAFKPVGSRSQAAAQEDPDLASENVAPSGALAPSAPAPAPEAAPAAPADPAAAPAAGTAAPTDPSAAPAADPAAADPAAPTATPPPPPPGTTKAPPTDLVKPNK